MAVLLDEEYVSTDKFFKHLLSRYNNDPNSCLFMLDYWCMPESSNNFNLRLTTALRTNSQVWYNAKK